MTQSGATEIPAGSPASELRVGQRITEDMLTYLPEDVEGGYLTQEDIDYMRGRMPGGGTYTVAPGSDPFFDPTSPVVPFEEDPIVSTGTGQVYVDDDGNIVEYGTEIETYAGSTYDEAGINVTPNAQNNADGAVPTSEVNEANMRASINNSQNQAGAGNPAPTGDPINPPNPADRLPVWQKFYSEVSGRHNVLHDYNSYNYQITLVALSNDQVKNPEQYKGRVINTAGVESDSFYVIAKTGGYERANAVTNPQGDFDGATGQQSYKGEPGERNKDLFIENLVFDTRAGINDMGNSNLTTGTFEVIEPHGVGGFYRELYAGSRFAGHENYIGAPFLLVISFIGRMASKPDATVPEKTTRYLPIRLRSSEMAVNEGGARYTVSFMGFNAYGASAPVSALWDNTEPRVLPQESVESICYSIFYQNTKNLQKILDKHKEDQSAEDQAATREKIADAGTVRRASEGGVGSGNIGAFLGHKYYVWFAKNYTTFPSNTQSFASSYWEQRVSSFVDVQGTTPQSFSLGGALSNEMGNAGLNDSVSPSGGLSVQAHEDAVKAHQEKVDEEVAKRQRLERQFNTELRTFEAKRESLAAKLNAQLGDRERLTETNRAADLTITPSSTQDEIVNQVEEARQDAINLANITGDPAHPVYGGQANLSETELAEVVTLRNEIMTSANRLIALSGDIVNSKVEIERLQNAGDEINQRVYDLSSSGTAWSFRKGTSLTDVIDTMITNSQYMDIFQDTTKLNNIANTGFIPWYKVDIYPVIIGFDVITMDFQYEFHYVVSPYQVHYSKMPGVNIIFSTEKLRELAVREYNYIFTGKNLDVLKFDIKYNNLFKTPMLLSPPNQEALGAQRQREEVVNTYITNNNYDNVVDRISNLISNRLGETGFTPAQATEPLGYRGMEVTNRNHIGIALKEFLYNPPYEQALIRAELEIVGDPVYIVGSGIVDRPVVNENDILTPDGEINAFTREPDVIFNFRYPEDLPTSQELQGGAYEQKLLTGEYSGLYQVTKIENRFSDGVFTQNLTLLRRKNQEQDYELDLTATGAGVANQAPEDGT